MLSPALAIGWLIWRRHGWGLLLGLGGLVLAVLVANTLPGGQMQTPGLRVVFGALILPIFTFGIYLMTIFTFGAETDLNTSGSCFPCGLLTLPVRTSALAGWHLSYGAASLFLLWLVAAGFVLRPWLAPLGLLVPLWWPAMLAAALLSWFQALLWLPFGLPWLRVVVTTVLLTALIVIAFVAGQSSAPEGLLVGFFAGLGALGWVGAYEGVRRARRGDVPSWERILRPLRRLALWRPRARQPFASALAAQVWFEWRRMARSLPTMTALLLPIQLLPLFLDKYRAFPTSGTLFYLLALPVFLAGIAGTVVSGRNPWVKDYYGVAPFTATLPLTTAALLGAKLKAAARSVLVTWLLAALGIVVVLTRRFDEVARWWEHATGETPPAQLVVTMGTAAVLLVLWTWKRQVDSMLAVLTGRKWVITVNNVLSMATFAGACVLGGWLLDHPEKHAGLLNWLPWILGLWLLVRLVATGLALRATLHRRLLAPPTVVCWAGGGLLLAATLFGLLAASPLGERVAWYYLALAVLWCTPMTHLATAALALAWNRHR